MTTKNQRPSGWNAATGAYVTTMQAAGRRPGTVRLHRHYLGLLATRYPAGPWRLGTQQLEAFLAKPTWKPETRKSARTVVAGFYRWAHGRGFLEEDPASYLMPISVPTARPRPTPEFIVARVAREDDRDGYMAMLAAYAGARAGEIAQVLPARDLVGDELTLHGKGGKERVVPVIHPPLLRRLRADARTGDRENGWAFPNGRGSHISSGHVTKLLSAALPDGWTGHTLRHRFATQAHHGTRDLLAVSELLGHARVETTQRYVLVGDDARRAAVVSAAELRDGAGSVLARPGQDAVHLGLGQPGQAGGLGGQPAGVVDVLNDQLVALLPLLLDRLRQPGEPLGAGLDPLGEVRQVVDHGGSGGASAHHAGLSAVGV